MSSPVNRRSETQSLLASSTTQYGTTGSTEAPMQIDPVVLARAMQIITQQMAAQQTRQENPPPIVHVTAQQTLTLPEGTYTGDVANNKPHGRGSLSYYPGNASYKRYDGEWQDGKFHGKGLVIFADDGRYEGEFKNGKQHGKGIRHFSDGAKYEGGYVDGSTQGKGTIRFANGDIYDGDWVKSIKEGQGTYKYNNGNIYKGGWKASKRHGQGTLTFREGGFYQGAWENDKYNGPGKEVAVDGTVAIGTFKNDNLWDGTSAGLILKDGKFDHTGINPRICGSMVVLTAVSPGLMIIGWTTGEETTFFVGMGWLLCVCLFGCCMYKPWCNQPRKKDSIWGP